MISRILFDTIGSMLDGLRRKLKVTERYIGARTRYKAHVCGEIDRKLQCNRVWKLIDTGCYQT